MEGEGQMFVFVSLSMAVLATYARWASSKLSPGTQRLLALLPAIVIVSILPFCFSSVQLRGDAGFFLGWLAMFKLALLAFGAGPLHPSLSLLAFISITCLPVEVRDPSEEKKSSLSLSPSPLPFINSTVLNAALLPVILSLYSYKDSIHPYLLIAIYCCHIYLTLEVMLALSAALARKLLGLELAPQFDAPYLSASLQDFWGRRWNLMVTNILRPSVYIPVRALWGTDLAILSTFLISGIMHELMVFIYLGKFAIPTGELTCFFLLHGLCMVAERQARQRWGLVIHPAVAAPLSVGFVALTAAWLFFPPLVRLEIDTKSIEEFKVIAGWLKSWAKAITALVNFQISL